MKMRLGTLILITTLASSTMIAAPAVADDASDAKAHYQKATAHYAVGEYHDAAVEYEEAYKAKQDPALLYNAAQSHRLANDNQKALLLSKNIVKLYPTSKYAVESKDRIDKLSAAIATSAPAADTRPSPTTRAATGTARSARATPASAGSSSVSASCCRPATSMRSSRCRVNWLRLRCRTSR